MAINDCPLCLEKQREIDDLREENMSLRAALRREQRKMEDGEFGSSTPSSKIPIKPNSQEIEKKPKGARQDIGETVEKAMRLNRLIASWR